MEHHDIMLYTLSSDNKILFKIKYNTEKGKWSSDLKYLQSMLTDTEGDKSQPRNN